MADESNPLRELWADLDQQALTAPESEKPTPPKAQLSRRFSLADKAVGAFLSGRLPVYLLLCVGTLTAMSPLSQTTGFSGPVQESFAVAPVLAMVLLLPVAWLVADLLRASRATGARYWIVALLAGGLAQIMAAIPLSLFSLALNGTPDFWALMETLPPLLESYLSVSSWVIYTLASILLLAALKRLRRSCPWVETSSQAPTWRQIPAVLLLGLPWLLLAGAFLAQGRIAPQELAWIAQAETIPLHFPQPPVTQSVELRELANRVSRAPRPRTSPWVVKDLEGLERQALTLFASIDGRLEGQPRYDALDIMRALISNHDKLRDPMQLGWRFLGFDVNQRAPYHDDVPRNCVTELLLPGLCQRSMSAKQLRTSLEQLDAFEATLLEPEEELDAMILLEYRESTRNFVPSKPFRAFGLDLPFSVEGALEEIRMFQRLSLWLKVKEQLRWKDANALEISARAQSKALRPVESQERYSQRSPAERIIEGGVGRCLTLKLRPYLQTVRAVLALRLYKDSHGEFPETLEAVASELDAGAPAASFVYQRVGNKAQLTRAGVFNTQTRNSTWTLY